MVIRFKKKTEETAAQAGAGTPAPVPVPLPPVVALPKVMPPQTSISAIFAKKEKLLRLSAAMTAGATMAAAGIAGCAVAASMGSIVNISAAGIIGSALAHKFNPKAKSGVLQAPERLWMRESADDAEAAVNDGLSGRITVKGPLQYKQRGTMWMVA